MRFAAPWGLAGLALLGPLVVWYLLRSRRTRRVVPSTLVWQAVPRAMTAVTPWQRFQPDATFWLAALAVAIGSVALARPYAVVDATLGDHTVVIVDASGSMSARDGATTRLEAARRHVVDLVDGLGDGQEVSLVEAGSPARILVAGATSTEEVGGGLARLRAQDGRADLADALVLATALQRADQATVLHVVTDTEVPPDLVAGRAVSIEPIGSPVDNLAVTRLQVVPRGSGTSEVFVALRSWATHPVQARLSVTVDDVEVAAEVLDLEPRASMDRTIQVRGGAGDVVRAAVVATDDTVDDLPLDDAAFGLLRRPERVRVTAATPGNVFLTAALEAVEGVELRVVDTVPDDLGDVDLLVVDRLDLPDDVAVPTLLVAPTAWPDGIEAGGVVDLPTLTTQSDHELLASVDLSDVAVATGRPLSGDDLTPVAGGPDGVLVSAGRVRGTPTVALGFALTDSNLPLTAAWPTLVSNAVGWLAGAPATVAAVAGTPVRVDVPPGLESVRVSPPDGGEVEVTAVAPVLVVDRVGLWRVAPGRPAPDAPAGVVDDLGDLGAVVVNADAAEGDLAQAPPERMVATVVAGGPALAPGRQPLAAWIVPVVLALVLAEWLRATVPGRRGGARDGGRGSRPGDGRGAPASAPGGRRARDRWPAGRARRAGGSS